MAQSILYILPPELPVVYDGVGGAQQAALAKKLPFAVVYQLRERHDEFETQLEQLRVAEKQLAEVNIPLILLLGPSEVILASLTRHADAEVLAEAKAHRALENHPYEWPGMVRSINDLQPLIDQMTADENRTFC